MEDQASQSITPPSIAKSAAITTIGKSWGAIGTSGKASFQLPLPISSGRGFNPALGLSYDSQAGNGPFGIGWRLTVSTITRQTSKGVPRYLQDDVFLSPSGDPMMPELDKDGHIQSRFEDHYNGEPVGKHSVVRYWPRVEGAFDLFELWQPSAKSGEPPFWLVHQADGSLHIYGKTEASRRADPHDRLRVGAWLLLESMTPHGDHIAYEYKPEDLLDDQPHDYRAQRYLRRVCYGNFSASKHLYAWTVDNPAMLDWHFHLLFDYGERTLDWSKKPVYGEPFLQPDDDIGEWLIRRDSFFTYGHGFELSTRRLCQQVLMFHYFPAELGPKPALVKRLLLEYHPEPAFYSQLCAAHYQAYDASDAVENMPPMEFEYSSPDINTQPTPFFPFEHVPGIQDGEHHQCLDLYGEGVPGFLCRYDQAWYYREPQRGPNHPDEIIYGPWRVLPTIPVADGSKPVKQSLNDLTGDGRLDWILAQPDYSGFFALNPDRSWSPFSTFTYFPLEFFNALAQFGDLTGNGLSSLALIGPKSVRLYPSLREDGFGPAKDVPHEPDNDSLPLFSTSRSELVFLGRMLGSDLPDLCRIRNDEIKCWPNLGHGRFGKGFVMDTLPFEYGKFDAARVRIADLDGSGAPALIYLDSDHFDTQTDAGGHLQHTRYNIAGQLKQVMLQLDTASPRQDILKDAQYNADGKVIEQRAGNGVVSIWGYNPIDGRLHTLKAGIPGKALCQDLEYLHDRVGNVLRIEDHTLSTVFFANQRVDGLRTFAYDSLYRLIRASGFEAEKPNPQPSLPDLITPIDPGRRFNYTQHYDYDRGNNLTKLCHRRDGNNFTRQMCIDEHSNRGVSWEEGDPVPIFKNLFDPHGNQLLLQRGQPMSWNTRDQLAKVTLLTHSNGLPDDEETYLYSQGVRVYKHHVWHTPSANHFHDVRYLPGLEIRTRSDGQQLHVITLSTGVGSVHCLHWVSGIPADIEPDQLRYHLGDHLNSIALELDRNGALISLEFYYSYGGTCWYAARSEVEADYKTLRYSGKEMDVSGLYYYGARYYAPWLWRWVSPDPAGNVDGLNRYQMVGSNPIRSIDNGGTNKEDHEQLRQDLTYYASVLSTLGKELKSLNYQINNSFNSTDINKRLIKNLTFHAAKGLAKEGVSTATKLALPGVPGPIVAFAASFITGLIADELGKKGEFSTSMLPNASKLDPHTIHAESTGLFTRQKVKNIMGSYDPRTSQGQEKSAKLAVSITLGEAGLPAASSIIEAGTSIKDAGIAHIGIPEESIEALRFGLVRIVELLEQDGSDVPAAFNTLGVPEFYADGVKGAAHKVFDSATGHLGTNDSKTIKLEKLEQKRETRIAQAERGIVLLDKYSEYIRKR